MSTITIKGNKPGAQDKSVPVTLEQQRAQFAWQYAQDGVAKAGKEYQILAKAAPALIINNGLMQTLAFYQEKNKDHHQRLGEHLRRWLMVREGGPDRDIGFELVMRSLLDSDSNRYRRATDEALLILRWIRQFATAL